MGSIQVLNIFFRRESGFVQRIRIDRESEANHDLIRWLNKPDIEGGPIIKEIAFPGGYG